MTLRTPHLAPDFAGQPVYNNRNLVIFS